MEDIIILGAGLSGLSTAYYLKQKNIKCRILEAKSRLGGRIQTIYGKLDTPMEMGATWFGNQHLHVQELLAELQIGFFKQHDEGIALFEAMSFEPPQQFFIPAADSPYYRIKNGTCAIIDRLSQIIGPDTIQLNTVVARITDEGDHICVTDSLNKVYRCKTLVSTIPPKVLINTVQFLPALPAQVAATMQEVQTWMSGSVKFAVEYATPFWREKGFSGTIFSQSGLATEIYDHSDFKDSAFALKGFLNGSAFHYTREERQAKVIGQLAHYFGETAKGFTSYQDKIWNDQFITSGNDSFLPPHHKNGHAIFQDNYMNNKLFLSGTETSTQYGGYMDGAIQSAKSVANKIIQ
ncbi:flavin monoamine oxidase family protein [Flavihumibacter profundi]|jgi:monoamine oxidase|uniref:flavin monoamine oxidase family protein n=1 Tax=Flavihumibacter profundi TaxID=2716883 RepID=UPI001CC4CE36|nr:NAD(P)/FAD-dependent oxidoreductase [Flavihumibacter profundi]MBZ5856033.1 FAD-dependent oxidoreductase [Flavihumibacter profundi]